MIRLALSSLWWRLAQVSRCRRGQHIWRTVTSGSRSDFIACTHCPEIGYRLKETAPRG